MIDRSSAEAQETSKGSGAAGSRRIRQDDPCASRPAGTGAVAVLRQAMDAVRVVVVDLPAVRARALELQVLAIHAVADAEDFVLRSSSSAASMRKYLLNPSPRLRRSMSCMVVMPFRCSDFADAALRPVPSWKPCRAGKIAASAVARTPIRKAVATFDGVEADHCGVSGVGARRWRHRNPDRGDQRAPADSR